MTLASDCATAMDESWFLEQSQNPSIRDTAKIHLLRCHEYDKMRKIMMVFGLDENVLAYLGLNALEINQRTADEFIKQHRFQER